MTSSWLMLIFKTQIKVVHQSHCSCNIHGWEQPEAFAYLAVNHRESIYCFYNCILLLQISYCILKAKIIYKKKLSEFNLVIYYNLTLHSSNILNYNFQCALNLLICLEICRLTAGNFKEKTIFVPYKISTQVYRFSRNSLQIWYIRLIAQDCDLFSCSVTANKLELKILGAS